MAEYGRGGSSLSQTRDYHSHTSEEDDDHSPSRTGALFMIHSGTRSDVTPPTKPSSSNNKSVAGSGSGTGRDVGSSGEINRKPRGRPPGSKNKPKPPIVITRDSDAAMRPVILELSAGTDIVEMVSQYARRRHVGLCVLSGSGTVANVTLRLPVPHASTLILHGPYHILSLSATFLCSSVSSSKSSSSTSITSPSITISLAGAQGQVFGGTVAGSLTAASNVVLVAASFVNPSFQKLPICEEEETEDVKPNVGGCSASGTDACTETNTSMSMNVYNVQSPTPLSCQISPDVLSWPSTNRSSHY
ncbi:AT-hook motif nuclear-localized protein 28-like [Telopea speciosissima]|uniref:AT-hook motif nuclear-localized protein 28-like n=1 Tax=Telopea speciosissima TaxID=54955 RepID=UPI001CC811D2|nr:AT-hook motif nuclear-localized protein 28-like [Telopea speciosissima]